MIVDDIALTMQSRVGPRTAAHLLSVFGSAERIFGATADELIEKAELRPDIAAELVKKKHHRQAESELRNCENNGITAIPSTSESYPPLLRECGDYPHIIYYKGDPQALSGRMLSIVGTRRMTAYGQRAINDTIQGLAEMFPGLVIVSGLAYGVDAACHRAALMNGLPTIGVLANQLPSIYPSQHTMLATEMIKKGGGLLTEYNSSNKNKGVNFVPRNRIIAGMSTGTLIIESPAKGGSLITAGMAEGYHRNVMALPGRAGDLCSEGTNYLIKSNRAVMVCSAEDIVRELMWDLNPGPEKQKEMAGNISEQAMRLMCHIPEGGQLAIDELAESADMTISELAPLLLELEFEGAVRVLPGKIYERCF